MITVILHGCKGRMGQVIMDLLSESEHLVLGAGIDREVDGTEGYPAYATFEECPLIGDVLIDFSHHTCVSGVLDYCVSNNTPAVIATTALGETERAAIEEASRSIPVFNSFNMSLGINAIAKLMKTLVPLLENEFNIEIVEKHHNRKKDSPSGTSLLLADAINDSCQTKKTYVYGRHGKDDDCKLSDLGIHAVRGGTIPGEHTIIFAGPDEVIEITHTALSRSIFARGSLKAAEYIITCGKGLYSMADLI